jgi:hypothetical protein
MSSDDARTLRTSQAAACTCRVAFGPRAGQKLIKAGRHAARAWVERDLCAGTRSFTLYAAVRCEAEDCQGLERLCRYITRPALADARTAAS